jgi:hypothetical protein
MILFTLIYHTTHFTSINIACFKPPFSFVYILSDCQIDTINECKDEEICKNGRHRLEGDFLGNPIGLGI